MRDPTPLLALSLLLAAACSRLEARSTGVIGESMQQDPRATALHSIVEHSEPVSVGDTIRLREVLVNLADTAITAAANPCRPRLGGTLQVRVLGDPRQDCPAAPVRIAPGDSLATERLAVVASPPGVYELELRRSGASADRRSSWDGVSTSRVRVVEPGREPRRARAPRVASPRIPFVLRVHGTPRPGTTQEGLSKLVQKAATPLGVFPIELHPDAPAAAPGLVVLAVSVAWSADGSHEVTMGYEQGGRRCAGSSAAGRFPNRAAFEEDLALRVRSQLQAYAGCLPRLASAAAR
ncbi:MAG TPA: hypothetical protein VF615_17475 [Longimicrobiaceae bacterium]